MNKYLIFKLEEEKYGLPVGNIIEIINHQKSTILPNQEDYMEGVIDFRGAVIPVLNLVKFVGLNFKNNTNNIIITNTGKNEKNVGYSVTSTVEIAELEVENVPATMESKDYIEGIAKFKDDIIVLLKL